VEYHPPRFEGKLDIEIIKANDLYNTDSGFEVLSLSDSSHMKIRLT
jgi:hypothetical protein